MVSKIWLIVGGSILMGLFLAWMLFKGTDAVRMWTATNPLLGLAAWGLSWLCLLGGAGLIVRAIYRRASDAQRD